MKIKISIFLKAIFGIAVASGVHAQTIDPLYLVYMNPFYVQKHEENARAAGYARATIPVVIRDEERGNYILQNLDKFNYSLGAEQAKNEIAKQFAIRNIGTTALQMPAFYANLSETEVENLIKSGYVVSVDRIENDLKDVAFSAYYDYTIAGEVTPWAKQAVGADDFISVANNFYIVDAPYISPVLSNEINLYSINSTGVGDDHPASVLSLAVAKSNSAKIRGINPGQPVVHHSTDLSAQSIINSIALISSWSEWLGQFSTLNLSFNYTGQVQSSNRFNSEDVYGRVIRRASGRLFVTQSAGNYNRDACIGSFYYTPNHNAAPTQVNDGIMVVGGVDRFGDRYQKTNNPYPYATEDRSNYGSCVEVWAPGQLMTTTLSDGTLVSATGTSFAAPIVAAIAGRYGDATTRPIEREAYIRNGMIFTGKYEGAPGSNFPINLVQYTPPTSHKIPKRLPIAAVYSNTNTTNINKLVDGLFYDGIDWNAGAGWGSIVLDVGSGKNLKGIRLMIRSSANGGRIDFAVHGGNSISITAPGKAVIPADPIAYKTINDQYDLIPYYIPINGNYRYIMVEANNYVSWLSYSEVEVYGD
jgi:hypothetical protein